MIILSILFFVTALIYSSVGFGGGSTYLAILLIWGVPYTIFPVIALVCNIIVVSGNSINFIRSKNINFNLLFPYLIGSVPFAFVGGSIKIEKNLFVITSGPVPPNPSELVLSSQVKELFAYAQKNYDYFFIDHTKNKNF